MGVKDSNSVGKPPYLLGILCIIPLIGLFVGVFLIYYGLAKYKNRTLTLIGIAGVIFTVALYGYLFLDLRYGKETARGFARNSQIIVTHLATEIEMYKYKKGSYPDSLEQLLLDDPLANIYDPLLIMQMNRKAKNTFFYQRAGDKYVLFSVGLDRRPNTPDDIYPRIAERDSSKYGLLRR
jgi:hypothetical protein